MSEETKEVSTKPAGNPALAKPGFVFLPQSWGELYNYAKEICKTDFVPKAFSGKPEMVLAAWQTGQEVGLPPMASLTSIAIINGRPTIHSNGYWALIVNHPLCEWFKETSPDEALKQGFGECTIKRRGNPHPITRRFTIEEAKTAKLIDKDNWKNYPGDMLQNRARHRAGDDAIPEATQGLLPSAVAQDLEPLDVTPAHEPFKEPKAIANGGGVKAPVRLQEDKHPDPVEARSKEGVAGPTEFEKALAWAKNEVTPETTTEELTKRLQGLSTKEKMDVCNEYNARKRGGGEAQ